MQCFYTNCPVRKRLQLRYILSSITAVLKQLSRSVGWQPTQKRPLTTGEKILVNSVFQQQINLELPTICAARWVFKGYAISPNGHIYFNPADYLSDFSKATLGKQAWFIHEMTHVWQVQQGIKVIRHAVIDRRYQYLLQAGKSFAQYGVEQQAQMVQDFFVQRSLGQDCRALQACLPFFKAN